LLPQFDANHHLRIYGLNWIAGRLLPADSRPQRRRTGTQGGRKRILPLAEVGYAIVARKFCSPGCRGEINPIGWNEDVLCFVDVKARTTHNGKIPEAAVDRHNRREVAQVARSYRRRLPP
jgi:putative endonuclease